ncbi:MAG: hypothetical protein QNJ65_04600 [Xenococcaceae cyanobacterium MO_234.B1]|nr:hypothetical protein [Xenococcaceae cyanobacterium MO_234.B1]
MSTPITLSATTAVGQLYELCNVLSSYNFYAMGGSIIENIQTLPNALLSLTDQFNFTTEPSTEPLPAIPDYNRVVVNTFERYLFHYSSILWASLENKRNKNDAINLITTNVETAINFRLEMTVYSVEPSTPEPTLEVLEFS